MGSEFGCRLTDTAAEDLDGIVCHLAVRLADPQGAAALLGRIRKVLDRIRPYRKIWKMPIGDYLLYYLPDMDARIIYILRIVHAKRAPDVIPDEIRRELNRQQGLPPSDPAGAEQAAIP